LVIHIKQKNLDIVIKRNLAAEIVVYTIPIFIGFGIKNKDGQVIQDRDAFANYIFNELSLEGIIGIGKKER
jgi:hypothetical protein